MCENILRKIFYSVSRLAISNFNFCNKGLIENLTLMVWMISVYLILNFFFLLICFSKNQQDKYFALMLVYMYIFKMAVFDFCVSHFLFRYYLFQFTQSSIAQYQIQSNLIPTLLKLPMHNLIISSQQNER